jgi:hypothetical protein
MIGVLTSVHYVYNIRARLMVRIGQRQDMI